MAAATHRLCGCRSLFTPTDAASHSRQHTEEGGPEIRDGKNAKKCVQSGNQDQVSGASSPPPYDPVNARGQAGTSSPARPLLIPQVDRPEQITSAPCANEKSERRPIRPGGSAQSGEQSHLLPPPYTETPILYSMSDCTKRPCLFKRHRCPWLVPIHPGSRLSLDKPRDRETTRGKRDEGAPTSCRMRLTQRAAFPHPTDPDQNK